ncbi:MAG TPA: excinuclease ABC subunit UvrA [Opitutaceae bacterium]|nr:excinuclease ABC subunit UvrA [Opitutaceae bacterium]
MVKPRPAGPSPECIRLRGVRQNNLKGFDLDLPLGQYIVVTGLSGAGKSSLVFDTLHAEGQRRYVETFSAYTRQFLDLLDKPKVDSIENIRPSIAIRQTNTVKTSRSTVGTMTELCDFFKVWFSHVAECFDPATGEKVEDDNPQTIWAKAAAAQAGANVVVAFEIKKPESLSWPEILKNLKNQSYVRVLVPANSGALTTHRVDDLLADAAPLKNAAHLFVAQDRISLAPENKNRFLEAVEAALHFGQGQVRLFGADTLAECGHFSRGLHSPKTGRSFRPAMPALFSFNSPLGACPKCRGFGRVIEIDYRLAIPDQSLSINDGAIKCWEGDIYSESKRDLTAFAKKKKIPTGIPFAKLTPEQKTYIIDGEPGYGKNGLEWPRAWYGLKGFFRYLESKTYKMHVRVFLSRYRTYNPCPDCGSTRLQPEALCWKWHGHTLPGLYQLPVGELLALISQSGTLDPKSVVEAHSVKLAHDSILTRLRYLEQVGLGYLTLDRTSRTLSGGEVERVNLTSCLGTSLRDTLFVLDEPSVGLHPRDIDRLIGIIRSLTSAGNTVVVVEHDEAMIRAADHVIEIGPEPGSRGGHIVFQGTVAELPGAPQSITGAYFSGRERIEIPAQRRPVVCHPSNFVGGVPSPRMADEGVRPTSGSFASPIRQAQALSLSNGLRMTAKDQKWLSFTHATKHNLQKLSFRLPLQRFVCLSGVSGSGKSTLLDNVIYQGLLTQRLQLTDDPAVIEKIEVDRAFSEIVLVDQSPLSRTPRSNPALYTEAWVLIRELFADTPAAQAAGFSPSSFSFNSGDGRCDHCQGLGYERVEMQFLSDVFVPCPVCEGSRFKPEVLAITWNGKTVADLLATSISDALPLFAEHQKIQQRIAALVEVGLGYLTLGQPLNTLSGGEAQRLKLVKYLGAFGSAEAQISNLKSQISNSAPAGALLLLDEPTTGLHRHDVKRLLGVLNALVERGHSVVVIEHNLDVLKSADWILEIGPEAGSAGGRIVAEGTPEDIAAVDTATSPFLRAALADSSRFQVQGSRLLAAEDPGSYESANFEPGTGNLEPRSSNRELQIIGARENNLQGLSLTIPHRQLTVVTGVSGSGKSTLAFDIVFAEGQRRFMESMSPYARQFVEQLPRPAIDRLTGIPPTVAIEQRVTRGSRKSTVATITEVAQYLRLLYARLGVQHHPDTDRPVTPLSPGQLKKLLARLLASPPARRAKHLYLCAPLIRGRKGHHQPIATWIAHQGYEFMRVDGRLVRVKDFQKLDRYKEHDIEVVVADLKSSAFTVHGSLSARRPKTVNRELKTVNFPSDALNTALRLGKGSCFVLLPNGNTLSWFSTTRTDIETGESFPEPDPKHFSFNSPKGWCPACRGHGRIFPWMLEPDDEDDEDPAAQLRVFGIESGDDVAEDGTPCPQCHGERLNRAARAVKLHFRGQRPPLSLPALLRSTPAQLLAHLRALELDARGRLITQDIVPQIGERLRFLDHVGLGYLALDRPTGTLSGGEAQRIRLAAQLGTNLAGVLYVLDEPSIGLHARDNDRLIETLETLRDKGNTLLVVEHDDELMERADHIIDLGPGAGVHGGRLLASGTPAEIKKIPSSLTGLYLDRGIRHPLRGAYRPVVAGVADPGMPAIALAKAGHGWLEFTGVGFRNLKNLDLRLPLGRLVMVAGPSGAGKSTLFRDLLHPAVAHAIKANKPKLTGRKFVKATKFANDDPSSFVIRHSSFAMGRPSLPFAELSGANAFRTVIEVDQAPIGKTPRSTPATYLGIFDLIRQFFATLPEARMRGYTASRFSFNTAGGRCETCQGAGRIKLEMAFMPDAFLPCDACGGLRYGPELADIAWKGKTIGQVLQLTFEEAAQFFGFHARLGEVCRLMVDCGLGYLTLGQSSPTLSGGEAQRLKLVTELAHGLQSFKERSRGIQPRNLYLLEEPTIGLHLSDCEKLIRVLHSLVDQGHTVVVIEHHLDLLAEADWIVELGPGGGPDGGELIYQGPVAGLLKIKRSPTAPYLRAKTRKEKTRTPQLTVAVN